MNSVGVSLVKIYSSPICLANWEGVAEKCCFIVLFHSQKRYNLAERVTNSVIVNQFLTAFIRKPNKEKVCMPATSCHSIEQ